MGSFCGSEVMYARFSQWLANTTPLSGQQISRYITAVQHHHKCVYISLDRKAMPTLQLQLKFLKKTRPANTRTRKPIIAKILRMWLPEIVNKPDTFYFAVAMTMAYSNMLRSGEYCCTTIKFKEDNRYRLNWNDITIGTNQYGVPTILRVTIKLPKSYGYKFKPEDTTSECTCKSHGFCALHLFIKYKAYVNPKDLTSSLFNDSKGIFLTPDRMNRVIKKLCIKFNMDPAGYGSHSFRSGSCTDLKIKGVDDIIIQKRGRWACAKTWQQFYLLLDMFDVLRLSRC